MTSCGGQHPAKWNGQTAVLFGNLIVTLNHGGMFLNFEQISSSDYVVLLALPTNHKGQH